MMEMPLIFALELAVLYLAGSYAMARLDGLLGFGSGSTSLGRLAFHLLVLPGVTFRGHPLLGVPSHGICNVTLAHSRPVQGKPAEPRGGCIQWFAQRATGVAMRHAVLGAGGVGGLVGGAPAKHS